MNTRRYRLDRLARNVELLESATRRSTNEVLRDVAQAAAAIESAALAALFAERPWQAWAALAQLSERQRIVAAIDYACWLREQGVELAWGDIRASWERKLAARAADAESLLALAEAGAFDDDGARYEDTGQEPEPAAVATIEVASSKGDGTTYTVAVDGSSCTCKGFFWRHTCRHVNEIVADAWGRAA
jgi:hypothetical protein